MSRKKLIKREDFSTSSSQQLPIVIESIDYSLDEDSDVIKYEFNMMELPFFTKDKTVRDGVAKQYNFSHVKNQYMRVVPSTNPKLIANKIPQEFDEKIFYGILRLSKEQGRQQVITDYFTLAKVSGIPYKSFKRIKDSIERLSTTYFEFNNIFYEANKQSIPFNHFKRFLLLHPVEIITLQDFYELSKEEQELFRPYFRNRKISEILALTIVDDIYKNLGDKHGFLFVSHNNLLAIDNAVARKLYLLLEKWHGWEQRSEMRRSCRFLASRLPLSWEKASITGTIKCIDSAAAFLKEKKLIVDYAITKQKPISETYIDFYFKDETSRLDPIGYDDTIKSITTGHETLEIDSVDDFIDDRQATIFEVIEASDPEIQKLFNELPENLKTDSVKRNLNQFSGKGFDYLKSNIDYSLKNYTDNFSAYLYKALNEDFAADQRQQEKIKRDKEQQRKERKKAEEAAEEAKRAEDKRLEQEAEKIYEKMSEAEKTAFHQKITSSRIEKQIIEGLLNGDMRTAAIYRIKEQLQKEKEKCKNI
jgi:hypothetical protein